jgi:hypothetical protein
MRTILLIIICVLSAAVQAEVYKWIDEKGVVHYGDKQQDGAAIEMQVDTSESETTSESNVSRDEKRRRIADALEEDRLEKKETREKKKAERERNKRQCNRLKDKMKRMKKAAGLYKLDKEGNRVILSDQQRSRNEKSLSNQIKKYCR